MKTTTNDKTKKSKGTQIGAALIEALSEAIEFTWRKDRGDYEDRFRKTCYR